MKKINNFKNYQPTRVLGISDKYNLKSWKYIIMRNTIMYVAICAAQVYGNTVPSVSNITVSQRANDSIVGIHYTLHDAENDRCTVSIIASNDSGSTWTITPSTDSLSGDMTDVSPGSRRITWDTKIDLANGYGPNHRIKILPDDSVMFWIYVNDPGVPGHEPFNGQMSKYETTDAQYCQFLNAALASGDIAVYDNKVYAASDVDHSEVYFELYNPDKRSSRSSQITYSDGIFKVRSRDDFSLIKHPVVEVSWYGAVAFCNYYGYRLPTEWEWQAVADYDGKPAEGCERMLGPSTLSVE